MRTPQPRRMLFACCRLGCQIRTGSSHLFIVTLSWMFRCNHVYTHFYIHSLTSPLLRILGTAIAIVLLLAFVERPSSLSASSDPHHRSVPWEPPCGLTESIEMVCLFVLCLDLAVKVNTSSIESICGFVSVETAASSLPCLSSELPDWLGGVQKEQMADQLHCSHFSFHHWLGFISQHGVWWGESHDFLDIGSQAVSYQSEVWRCKSQTWLKLLPRPFLTFHYEP